MNPNELTASLGESLGKIQSDLTNQMLDVYERAEEADEALQEFYPELEKTLHPDIMERLSEVLDKLQFIQNIATDALGGPDRLMRLQYERGTDDPLEVNTDMDTSPFVEFEGELYPLTDR